MPYTPSTYDPDWTGATLNNGAVLYDDLTGPPISILTDGVNDYAKIPYAAGMHTAGSTKGSQEIFLVVLSSGGVFVVGGQSNSSSNALSALDVYISGSNIYFVGNGGVAGQTIAVVALSKFKIGKLNVIHFTFEMDGVVLPQVYINGTEVDAYVSQSVHSGSVAFNADMTFGADTAGLLPFSGVGRFGKCWNNIRLTGSEVASRYAELAAYFTTFEGFENSRYLCNDVGSPAADAVGGRSWPVAGGATFNGDSITCLAASNQRWQRAGLVINPNLYFSFYISGKFPEIANALRRLLSADITLASPVIDIVGSGPTLVIDAYSQVSGGFAYVSIDTGVLKADALLQTWGIALSYERSGVANGKLRLAVKSSGGVSLSGSATTGTIDPTGALGSATQYLCQNHSGTIYCSHETEQVGVKNGLAFDETQLLAALDSLMPATGPGPDLARRLFLTSGRR